MQNKYNYGIFISDFSYMAPRIEGRGYHNYFILIHPHLIIIIIFQIKHLLAKIRAKRLCEATTLSAASRLLRAIIFQGRASPLAPYFSF